MAVLILLRKGPAQVPAAQAPLGFSFSPVRLQSAALCYLSLSVPLDHFIDPVSDFISVSCKLDLSGDEAAAPGTMRHHKRP